MSVKEYGAHHRMQLARSSSGSALLPTLSPLQQLRVGCCRSCLPNFYENSGFDGCPHKMNDIDDVDDRLDEYFSKFGWL